MKRLLACLVGLAILSSALGCAMCKNPYDCEFAAYGGVHQRTDQRRGRVASLFDPAPTMEGSSGSSQQYGEDVPPPNPDEVIETAFEEAESTAVLFE